MKKLNLGCGPDYRDGFINVDINPDFDPDIVVDLEQSDWSLPTNEFDIVLADNVLEHIDPRQRTVFLREVHRVLKQEGKFTLRWPTPGFGGGWDVTHYSIPSWDWPEHPNHNHAWNVVDTKFNYNLIGSVLPDSVANQLMWHGIRTVLDVELIVTPDEEYSKTW
jgi:predicted SAM-dependent methyltransferase